MADQLLEKARDIVEGQIDFEGQKLAELLATTLLTVVGGIAFIVGFFMQDIKLALYIGLGGTALTFAIVVPPWPVFKKNPVRWLPGAGNGVGSPAIMVDGKLIS